MTRRERRAATLALLVGGAIVVLGFLLGALTMPAQAGAAPVADRANSERTQ